MQLDVLRFDTVRDLTDGEGESQMEAPLLGFVEEKSKKRQSLGAGGSAIQVAALGSNTVGLLGKRGDDARYVLSVWDVVNGVVLEEMAVEGAGKLLSFRQEDGNFCTVGFGEAVVLVFVGKKQATLLEAMSGGSLTDSYWQAPQGEELPHCLDLGELVKHSAQAEKEGSEAVEALLGKMWESGKEEAALCQEALAHVLAGGSEKEVGKRLKEILDVGYKKAVAGTPSKSKKGKKARKSVGGTSYVTVEVLASAPTFAAEVATFCMAQGYWKPVSQLLAANALTYWAAPSLLKAAIDARQLAVVVACATTYSDLPEYALLDLLEYFLHDEDEAALATHLAGLLDGPSGDETRLQYLTLLMTLDVNADYLKQTLAQVPEADAVTLMAHLHRWFERLSGDVETEGSFAAVPKLAAVVQWTRVMADAHVSAMLFNEQCRKSVAAIHQQVRRHVNLCTELAPIKGYLMHLTSQARKAKPVPKVPAYSVEVLHL